MIKFLDLKRIDNSYKKKINIAVKNVIDSGWYLLGRELESFEEEFASYCGSKYGIGVASGTHALQLSLMVNNIGKDDEVITVANTAVPTIIAILSVGAKPIIADIESEFYTIDPTKIKEKITKKTKAIMPVHLFGNACEMDKINVIAKNNNLKVIEDACQAHGSEYKNKKLGTFGDMGCFSFYPSKNLGTYGDGGMIVTNNKKIADKLKIIRNCGHKKDYIHPYEGINSRLSEIQAAILKIKLKYLEELNERRRKLAKYYIKNLNNLRLALPEERHNSKSNFHLFVIRTKKRDKLRDYLVKKEIETMVHYSKPIYEQKPYKKYFDNTDFPATNKVMEEVLSLPLYSHISKKEIKYICNEIKCFFENNQ